MEGIVLTAFSDDGLTSLAPVTQPETANTNIMTNAIFHD